MAGVIGWIVDDEMPYTIREITTKVIDMQPTCCEPVVDPARERLSHTMPLQCQYHTAYSSFCGCILRDESNPND
jgi:hypothetical protein